MGNNTMGTMSHMVHVFVRARERFEQVYGLEGYSRTSLRFDPPLA